MMGVQRWQLRSWGFLCDQGSGLSPGGTDVNINDTHAITLMDRGSRDTAHNEITS